MPKPFLLGHFADIRPLHPGVPYGDAIEQVSDQAKVHSNTSGRLSFGGYFPGHQNSLFLVPVDITEPDI